MWNSPIWHDLLRFPNGLVHLHPVTKGYSEANVIAGLARIANCRNPAALSSLPISRWEILCCRETRLQAVYRWFQGEFIACSLNSMKGFIHSASTTHQCCSCDQSAWSPPIMSPRSFRGERGFCSIVGHDQSVFKTCPLHVDIFQFGYIINMEVYR